MAKAKDMFGRTLVEGDLIAYPTTSGDSPQIRLGRITGVRDDGSVQVVSGSMQWTDTFEIQNRGKPHPIRMTSKSIRLGSASTPLAVRTILAEAEKNG